MKKVRAAQLPRLREAFALRRKGVREWIVSSLEALRGDWVTVEELVEHSHLCESTVRRALEELLERGQVEKHPKVAGRGRRAYVTGYRLKERA